MINTIESIINECASQYGIEQQFVRHYIYLGLILILAMVCGLLFKKIVVPITKKLIVKTSFKVDDYIFTDNVFNTLSKLLPAFIVAALFPLCYIKKETSTLFYIVCTRAISIYIIILIAKLIGYVLSNIVKFSKSEYSDNDNHYLEAIVQFAKVLIFFFAGILILSVAINKNPTTLLAGLGAMATVLLLVFQDSILGLVAGVQLNANKMLKVGDWIEIPEKGINGNVMKLNLTTIKIQNFDNSISTIPPHKLVSETFKNWKGLDDFGGRQARLKLYIDVNSIKFVDGSLQDKLIQKGLVKENDVSANYGRIANVTLYRRFIENFLQNNDGIDSSKWLMVRQIENTALGMPLELYFYVKETDFVKYEEFVAEIFEYIVASAALFDLTIYQRIAK